MINPEHNIEFLNKLSDILVRKITPATTATAVNKVFANYLKTDEVEFIIWDNNGMILKDFSNGWRVYENDETGEPVNSLYVRLSETNGTKFFFNDKEFDFNLNPEEQYRLYELKGDDNLIILPLVSNGDVFGLMKIKSGKNAFTKEFFSLLNISSKLISGVIINYLLNEQMDISLNFYKAMKDIAKIIENQYELSYIIPLIGEMVDRFIPSHLIYIFIKKDEGFELVWPRACKDKSIYGMLEKLTIETEYLLSDDLKTGVFPLTSEDGIIGAIVAYSNLERLFKQDIDYLEQLTKQSGLTIQRANSYAEVLKYATMDALTGLNNRRQFEIRLRQEVSNSKRNNLPLCCMMLDVDFFKRVNDTHGHSSGDLVLKSVSSLIQKEIREYDIGCRYGGEEFFIILPQTKIQEAQSVAERLRRVVENTKMDLSDTSSVGVRFINVTISAGVCEYDYNAEPEALIQRVDKALYDAKENGRNRVIVG